MEQFFDELLRRELGQAQGLLEAPLRNVSGQRTGPSGVGGRQHERPREYQMARGELNHESPTERQPGHMRLAQTESVDEPGQAVRVARHAEALRSIRRTARAGCVPGHHGELVRECFDLAMPTRPAVTDVAVHEHQRWAMACTLIGDAEPVDLDLVHRIPLTTTRRHTDCSLFRGSELPRVRRSPA